MNTISALLKSGNSHESVQFIYSIHNALNQRQAYPILGLLFVTPIKIIAGAVQMVVGFVFAFILTITYLQVVPKEESGRPIGILLAHGVFGGLQVGYCILHAATLGIFGYYREQRNQLGDDDKSIEETPADEPGQI